MSLSNPDLDKKILEIKKKICKPNCKKCKRALHESIEIKSKIFNLSNKRQLDSENEPYKYYDVIEYTSDSLPNKYRKITSDNGTITKISIDIFKQRLPKEQEPYKPPKKKKSDRSYSKKTDETKKCYKRTSDDSKTTDEHPDEELTLDKKYQDFVKKIDLATIKHIITSDSEERKTDDPLKTVELHFSIPTTQETVKPPEKTITHQPPGSVDILAPKIPEPVQNEIEKPQEKVSETDLTIEQTDKPTGLFGIESKQSVDDRSPFDILHKINVPIPKGNPLFAPTQQESNIFTPKTDVTNFVFGQSQASIRKPDEQPNIFTNQQQQIQQNQLMNQQLVIPEAEEVGEEGEEDNSLFKHNVFYHSFINLSIFCTFHSTILYTSGF
ncbi:uncharacterized protein TA06120 [Theileria annulata]|uniref:Uncharacterized protein n=1 Tax=Theileria annulata TaxID=5874 RepID=Q4UI62_THEAN|nr:uncharacterized protein TA06120 [Theileria annulata]CAI73227.1 hypothetical protein TA06120 [Theileria annulata]|eukprot:XP_953904.1 hypothetical protein TA06120 [Theileria annulata]